MMASKSKRDPFLIKYDLMDYEEFNHFQRATDPDYPHRNRSDRIKRYEVYIRTSDSIQRAAVLAKFGKTDFISLPAHSIPITKVKVQPSPQNREKGKGGPGLIAGALDAMLQEDDTDYSRGFFSNEKKKTYEEHEHESGSSGAFHPFNSFSLFKPEGKISRSDFESHQLMEQQEDINQWMEEEEEENDDSGWL